MSKKPAKTAPKSTPPKAEKKEMAKAPKVAIAIALGKGKKCK